MDEDIYRPTLRPTLNNTGHPTAPTQSAAAIVGSMKEGLLDFLSVCDER